MKKMLLYAFCATALLSCSSDDVNSDLEIRDGIEIPNESYSDLKLKKDFGFALAKALDKSPELRSLIKEEALKQIDYDYDVLYELIRSQQLSGGQTVEELMLEFISANDLKNILHKMPTLTIFVPSLPDNSFSAEKWDISNEVPVVAIRTTEMNDVPIVEASGNEWVLEAQYTPVSPVVVVKDNERISTLEKQGNSLKSAANSSASFYFIDDIFNNEEGNRLKGSAAGGQRPGGGTGTTTPTTPSEPQYPKEMYKVREAYYLFKGTNNWQRDYIYYNLTSTNTRGVFNKNMMEHIVGFEMVNSNGSDDATAVINKICDQTGDPKTNGNTRPSYGTVNSNCWTDGELEFKVKCYVASTTGIGNETIKYMRFMPGELFSPVTITTGTGRQSSTHYVANKFILKKQVMVNLPLFEWNLEVISPSVKINIEEVDSQESSRQTTSTTTEFATNFEFSGTTGDSFKLGFKFGASAKKSQTVIYEVTTTKGNDELGDVILNFWDDVITADNPILYYDGSYFLDYNAKYNSGWYRIYIAPKKL